MARITAEEKGVDLYVLERAILSSHPTLDGLVRVHSTSIQLFSSDVLCYNNLV